MAGSRRSLEKEAFWRLVLEEHEASGLSVRGFCRRESVAEASFYAWRKEIRRRDHVPVSVDAPLIPDQPLIPVTVVDSDSPVTAATGVTASQLELLTPSGYTLRFEHDMDASRLGLLLTAIASSARGATSC